MPFHFCGEELMMLMVMFPFIGTIIIKIKNYFSSKKCLKCGEDHKES